MPSPSQKANRPKRLGDSLDLTAPGEGRNLLDGNESGIWLIGRKSSNVAYYNALQSGMFSRKFDSFQRGIYLYYSVPRPPRGIALTTSEGYDLSAPHFQGRFGFWGRQGIPTARHKYRYQTSIFSDAIRPAPSARRQLFLSIGVEQVTG